MHVHNMEHDICIWDVIHICTFYNVHIRKQRFMYISENRDSCTYQGTKGRNLCTKGTCGSDTGDFMKKVLIGTWALRDRYIVVIE